MITKESIFEEFKIAKEKDIAKSKTPPPYENVFTNRIKNLTEHLKLNKKDHNTRRGLMRLVGKRKKLLSYVKKKSNERYESIVKSLGLRR